MNKYKVTVYVWGQPPYITIIEAKQYGLYGDKVVCSFFGEGGVLVASFPTKMTSVELIP